VAEGDRAALKKPLPIDPLLPEIVSQLAKQKRLVLQAPPGAGKTTRVPAALLDAGIAGEIVVLEPRRLATRMAARRVAEERGVELGGEVGFEVRFERAVSSATRLKFVTEGILTRRLLSDPELRSVGAVVLDEFHERHLAADVGLALLQRLSATKRPDLSIVVMSATLDALPVAKYLGAPVLTSEGKAFEVSIEHTQRADDRPLESQVVSAVRELLQSGVRGDILVFLPGAAEIRRAIERAGALAAEGNLLLVPLHGDLSPAAQDLAVRPADRQKIIFSTNVAETSVTIEGVVAVVDSGLARIAKYDPWSGRPGLVVAKISRASAAQRAGRAGRLGPGRVKRLYTRGDHDARPEHDVPEIMRADLTETLLELHAADVHEPSTLAWLDAPPAPALSGAERLLERLGATDASGRLTEIGRRMTKLPLPPRLARLVVAAESLGIAEEGCLAAAILAEGRDVYAQSWDGASPRSTADEGSDLWARVSDVADAAGSGLDRDRARYLGLEPGVVAAVLRTRQQLLRLVQRRGAAPSPPQAEEPLGRAVLAAFPDRVARRRSAGEARLGASRELLLATGGTAFLAESSVVSTAPWLVAVEAGDRGVPTDRKRGGPPAGKQTRVWLASAIEPEWLIDVFPDAVREEVDVSWNADLERADAVERLVYEKLVIDERPAGRVADEAIARLLAERAIAAGIASLAGGDAFDKLRNRLRMLSAEAPDLASKAGLAPLDDEHLRALVAAAVHGKRSLAEVREANLLDQIRAAVGHPALARLDELLPEQITLRGGRRVKVQYEPGKPPWIESRLQDFFGSAETPRLLGGRLPLVLHLLAPNGRDVQVTTDLAGFWQRTYPSVRSELMRRYPRHAWPVDPLTASPPAPRRH
jgi:ATP-dependent helicase HrpB